MNDLIHDKITTPTFLDKIYRIGSILSTLVFALGLISFTLASFWLVSIAHFYHSGNCATGAESTKFENPPYEFEITCPKLQGDDHE